jgi:hypothetical protein
MLMLGFAAPCQAMTVLWLARGGWGWLMRVRDDLSWRVLWTGVPDCHA